MTCCLCFGSIIPGESRRDAARANQRPVFWWVLSNERRAWDNPSVSHKRPGDARRGKGAEIVKVRIDRLKGPTYWLTVRPRTVGWLPGPPGQSPAPPPVVRDTGSGSGPSPRRPGGMGGDVQIRWRDSRDVVFPRAPGTSVTPPLGVPGAPAPPPVAPREYRWRGEDETLQSFIQYSVAEAGIWRVRVIRAGGASLLVTLLSDRGGKMHWHSDVNIDVVIK